MLYVNIDFDYTYEEDITKGHSYDDIINKVIVETNKYIVNGLPIIGIVIKKDLYDWLIYQSKKNSVFYNNVKCNKIESFYGFKIAIKE